MISGDDLVPLLGLPLESPAVERLRQELDPSAEASEDDGDFFLSFPEKGIELLFDRERELDSIFLFSEGDSGARQFSGDLPEGLGFSMSRERVRALLGTPRRSGDGEIFSQREILPWDKYKRDGWSLHISYLSSLEAIRRVTLSSKKADEQLGD